MAFQVRRVITGHDMNGRAVVKIDGVSKHVFASRPGATACNVWTTEGFPASNDGNADEGLRKVGTTLKNGTIFRVIEFSPGVTARNHRTDSIDYIVAMYPQLSPEQVRAALAYYEVHPARVDEDFERHDRALAELQARGCPA